MDATEDNGIPKLVPPFSEKERWMYLQLLKLRSKDLTSTIQVDVFNDCDIDSILYVFVVYLCSFLNSRPVR
jgi:hypothetical protein